MVKEDKKGEDWYQQKQGVTGLMFLQQVAIYQELMSHGRNLNHNMTCVRLEIMFYLNC